jgi:hypothetical protein
MELRLVVLCCINMIEHEAHSHGHHTGRPWLDLILAGSAIFISLISLIISIHHGRTMEELVAANEKQVKASTLPILRFSTGNMSENKSVVHFDLNNGGTGPAIVEWLRIRWNEQPTSGPNDLFERCCGTKPQAAITIWQSTASGMTLPASQSQTVFALRPEADHDLYQRLDKEARFKIEAESCYCSVLEECWITDFKARPQNVKSCEAIPNNQRW